MSGGRRILIALLCVGGGVGAVYQWRMPILSSAGAWLDVGQPPCAAQDILLLNGSENTRPFLAAELIKGGWANRVLVATVNPSPQVLDEIVPPSETINCGVLRHCGVSADQVELLKVQARTTYDEAVALDNYLRSADSRQVLVVTDWYHARRTRWIMARVLGERQSRLALVSAPADEFHPDNWWQSEKGLEVVGSEYFKLAYYAVRYGYGAYVAVACVVLTLLLLTVRRWRRGGDGLVSA